MKLPVTFSNNIISFFKDHCSSNDMFLIYVTITSSSMINVSVSSQEILFTDSVVANKIISPSFRENIATFNGLCKK